MDMRIFLPALVLLAVPAQAQTRSAPVPPAHQRIAAPVHLTDAQIESAIRAKLAKSKIGADKFQFHVQGGVATIEGRTDVIQHKGAATRMAKTAGAVAVVNHIQISDAAKQRAQANLAKGRRRAQIKRGDARNETASAQRPPSATAPRERKTGAPSGQNR
jgi:BON domain